MVLTLLILVRVLTGVACLFARPRRLVELLNVACFTCVLALGVRLVAAVLANHGAPVTERQEFLRADALSAWMVLLIAAVSLATSVYAVRYFRRDLADAVVNERRFRGIYFCTSSV